jgi:hypothetical protein
MEINAQFYASEVPVEREVSLVLDSGEAIKQIFYFRELPSIEMRKQLLAEQSGDEKRVTGALSALIARGVCDADGNAVFSEEQAGKLKPVVTGQMRDLIMEVNGLKKPKASKAPEEPLDASTE